MSTYYHSAVAPFSASSFLFLCLLYSTWWKTQDTWVESNSCCRQYQPLSLLSILLLPLLFLPVIFDQPGENSRNLSWVNQLLQEPYRKICLPTHHSIFWHASVCPWFFFSVLSCSFNLVRSRNRELSQLEIVFMFYSSSFNLALSLLYLFCSLVSNRFSILAIALSH